MSSYDEVRINWKIKNATAIILWCAGVGFLYKYSTGQIQFLKEDGSALTNGAMYTTIANKTTIGLKVTSTKVLATIDGIVVQSENYIGADFSKTFKIALHLTTGINEFEASSNLSSIKYLIQDKNSTLYTYNGTNIISLSDSTVSDTNFILYGVPDLMAVPENIWRYVFQDITKIKILMWTDDTAKTEAKMVYDVNSLSIINKLKENNNGKFSILMKEFS